MEKIKVLIVDDQELFRTSLKTILENKNLYVVGTAENYTQLVDLLSSNQIDVILMDIRLPGINGVECTKMVKNKYPNTKVIVLTTFEDDEYVVNALKYGASGYLLKGISIDDLVKSIKVVYDGGALINSDVTVKVLKYFSQITYFYSDDINRKMLNDFNQKELSVIKLIGQGFSNNEISKKLSYSIGTIRNIVSNILAKTGFRDRTQIAIYAIQNGIFFNEQN